MASAELSFSVMYWARVVFASDAVHGIVAPIIRVVHFRGRVVGAFAHHIGGRDSIVTYRRVVPNRVLQQRASWHSYSLRTVAKSVAIRALGDSMMILIGT